MCKNTVQKNIFMFIMICCILFSFQFADFTAHAGGLGDEDYSPQKEPECYTSAIHSEDEFERPPNISDNVYTEESPPQISNPPNTLIEETTSQSGGTIINNYETNNYYSLFQINVDWNWDWDWDSFKESGDKSGIFQSIFDAVNGNIVPAFLYIIVGFLAKVLPDSKVLMLISKFLEKNFHPND